MGISYAGLISKRALMSVKYRKTIERMLEVFFLVSYFKFQNVECESHFFLSLQEFLYSVTFLVKDRGGMLYYNCKSFKSNIKSVAK